MQHLSNLINEKATGKLAIITLLIFLAFTATVLPAQSKKSEAYSNGAGSVDLSLLYTTDDVYEMAETYGEVGRQGYIRSALTFDVIWPIIYFVFLSSAIGFLSKQVLSPESKLLLLNLTPFLGTILDYIENGLASLTFYLYPEKLPFLTGLLPVATFLKWVFVGGASILVLIYLVAWGIKAISKNKKQ